VQLAGG